jgi:hypothetical protein
MTIYTRDIIHTHRDTTQKLRTWMHWNAGKEKCASTKPDITWLKDAMGKSKGRALQAIELYQQCYKDKIERRVKANFDLEGATTNKERMAVRRRVVSEMWKAEDEDIVAEITEGVEIEKEKKKSKKNEDKGEETLNDVEARSPEEYNAFVILCFHPEKMFQLTPYSSIQSLPLILQTAFQAITEATGWVFFISAGGPNPSDDGHIYMEK